MAFTDIVNLAHQKAIVLRDHSEEVSNMETQMFHLLLQKMHEYANSEFDKELLQIFEWYPVAIGQAFEISLPENNCFGMGSYGLPTKDYIHNLFVACWLGDGQGDTTGSVAMDKRLHDLLKRKTSCFWKSVDSLFPSELTQAAVSHALQESEFNYVK